MTSKVSVKEVQTGNAEEPEQIRQETRRAVKRFGRKRGNLIPVLQKVQSRLGYLPPEAMSEIAGFLGIPEVDVYGVVTFYNQFRLNPPGGTPSGYAWVPPAI